LEADKMHDQEKATVARRQLTELLAETIPPAAEQRATPRITFFGPVVVVHDEAGERREVSCFSRDISAQGIGLLHDAVLRLGPAWVRIPRRDVGHVELPCEILWCRPCGEGWHVAGAKFLLP
jgi:hypothetical protein